MKNALLRTAAFVLGFAGFVATADAQSLAAMNGGEGLVAMTSVRQTAEVEMDSKAAREERIVEVVASVKGYEANAELRSAIERRLVQDAPEATVLRAVMTGEKWTVKVNELGIPMSEYRKGMVVYRTAGQEEVVMQQVVVEREYFPLEASGSKYAVRLGTPRPQ